MNENTAQCNFSLVAYAWFLIHGSVISKPIHPRAFDGYLNFCLLEMPLCGAAGHTKSSLLGREKRAKCPTHGIASKIYLCIN